MFNDNPPKKGPLFTEFLTQKPTNIGATYPYPQHVILPPPPSGTIPVESKTRLSLRTFQSTLPVPTTASALVSIQRHCFCLKDKFGVGMINDKQKILCYECCIGLLPPFSSFPFEIMRYAHTGVIMLKVFSQNFVRDDIAMHKLVAGQLSSFTILDKSMPFCLRINTSWPPKFL